jgi:hypothetical protein
MRDYALSAGVGSVLLTAAVMVLGGGAAGRGRTRMRTMVADSSGAMAVVAVGWSLFTAYFGVVSGALASPIPHPLSLRTCGFPHTAYR